MFVRYVISDWWIYSLRQCKQQNPPEPLWYVSSLFHANTHPIKQVVPHIDGVKCVKLVALAADVDTDCCKKCLQVLLWHHSLVYCYLPIFNIYIVFMKSRMHMWMTFFSVSSFHSWNAWGHHTLLFCFVFVRRSTTLATPICAPLDSCFRSFFSCIILGASGPVSLQQYVCAAAGGGCALRWRSASRTCKCQLSCSPPFNPYE
jgi:hypothetical protein